MLPPNYETLEEFQDSMQRHLDERTEWLCWACEMLGVECYDDSIPPPGLQAWWQAHQEADHNRRLLEQIHQTAAARRKAVLAKLTAEDRDILGLEE